MTFNRAAWAIDGASLNSALARTEAFAAMSGAQGIVQAEDLKVLPLPTPGVGIQITAGAGVIRNGYQQRPNQSYTVTNPSAHQMLPSEMPSSSPQARSFIVAVTVGDPEFSQVGHPWMPSTIPVAERPTFQFVRPHLIQVANSSVTKLTGINYPALPLARIDIPANTTTITANMITDLRKLARPRTHLATSLDRVVNPMELSGAAGSIHWFPNAPGSLFDIPEWAVVCKMFVAIEGLWVSASPAISIRPKIWNSPVGGDWTEIREDQVSVSGARRNYTASGEIDIRPFAGTTQNFHLETRIDVAMPIAGIGFKTTTATSMYFQLYFEEQPT